MTNPNGPAPVLTSLWDGLSPHLIASFYPVERVEFASPFWGKNQEEPTVQAALIESNLEMAMGWHSPFENSGTDNVRPAVSAMLRSGALQLYADSDSSIGRFLQGVEGRTGITKLNSTQVFNGMPPVKITVTALFRAWRDTASEVMAPVNQLIKWALPQELAPEGPLMSALEEVKAFFNGKTLDEAAAKAAFPSVSPTKIALTYKGLTFSPLVIESIGLPLSSPVDKDGRFVELAVPMTLCSLTAIDRKDWDHATDPTFVYRGFKS
jgi:hypothetical protein